MRTTTNRTLTAALALTLSLSLAACGSADQEGAGVTTEQTTSAETTSAETTSDDADDTSDDADDTSDDAEDTSDDADDTGDTTTGAGGEDLTATALAAIATAEAEAGGTAYEIDDQDDDGTWEVDVAVDDRSVEVTVSADGATVEATEDDDLDEDDRAALDAATITLVDAITTAVTEVDGVLDDAELEEEDGSFFWEVSVDRTSNGAGDDDVEVRVDVTTGDVVEVD
ncbi:PepSY domain-containing protein [Ornithinimicrobium cerasi]|uniref:Peptidase propeptide and YPEB domain-containing protein n=1 Tax=Ornithinimicrobium cerasi TaxID=2248773 RepID=A0A285VJ09_9MICO|nr:PepSY domain-containing protein [Ornithinimicrobium cerasi]SOC52531.1 Peptidase propeptide and YPEB domain-containing protein [Ornithinimicrobium cerasi]